MLNNENIKNHWPKIKTQVLTKWSKLSEAEVEKTHGNVSSLGRLVQSKYGSIKDFDKTYERICESMTPSSKNTMKSSTQNDFLPQADGFNDTQKETQSKSKNDIENRDPREPSAEAGMPGQSTEHAFNEAMESGSPERRLNANYAKVEHTANMNREADDELSAYTATDSRISVGDFENDENEIKTDSDKANTRFTTPDEFYPFQDPTPSREDITLGRNTSSATKISTAKAAPISSEVSTNDAKRKL